MEEDSVMTEDDTFKLLRRIPFRQMIQEWSDCDLVSNSPGRDEFFNARGWDFHEYMEIYLEKRDSKSPDIFSD